MARQPTCGQGLAENAALPAKLAQLADALADNLAVHQSALDLSDERSRREREVYADLHARYREIADRLAAVARRMAEQRELPMGAHDPKASADPRVRDAFLEFVERERELSELLRDDVAGAERMLARG